MRIISIGSSPSSTVCISNKHVSAVHADLLLMDNGDIILTDKGSMNGTYLFGNRLEPFVDVPVSRGDKIEFAGCPLNWGSIPAIEIPDPSKVRGVYGVGTKPENRFCLSGNSVSRYHATIKEMKNGKWFIQDHSTNGTFINGQRISSNQDIQLKRGDKIVCGNVPLQNPVTGIHIPWKGISIGGAVAVAIVLLFLLIPKIVNPSNKVNPSKAVAVVTQVYRFKVNFSDVPEVVNQYFGGGDWYVGYGGLTRDEDNAYRRAHSGTAFFVSEKGLMLTNRHVTDWVWADKVYNGGKRILELKTLIETYRRTKYNEVREKYFLTDSQLSSFDLWLKSSFDLEIETIFLGVQLSGRTYGSWAEYERAHIEAQSQNDDVDMAVIRLNSMKTPEDVDYFRFGESIKDFKKLQMHGKNYYTIGYPLGESDITDKSKSAIVNPTFGLLHLVQAPTKNKLFMKGDESVHGQSGSPIYDDHNRLIGVLWGGWTATESTGGCPIVNADDLLKDILDTDTYQELYKSKAY